jgi:hypothetical protein
MWEWLKRQYRSLINFFSSLWPTPPVAPMPHYVPTQEAHGDIKASNISTLLGKTKDPIQELKEKAFTSIEHAKRLLLRNDLKNHLTCEELCNLINIHRKNLSIEFIQGSLKNNNITFSDLAKASAKNALTLLRSRFLNLFKADELADIYYTHRHDKTFLSALIEKRPAEIQYPSGTWIPALSFLLKKAYQEGVFDSACEIICKSTTLLLILSKELGYAQHKRQQHHHGHAMPQFPDKDPYAVLELPRDARDADIKKAYRKKVLIVHPDKIQTLNGNRFKEVNEAYEFLIDHEKRKAWDDAHPIENPPHLAKS